MSDKKYRQSGYDDDRGDARGSKTASRGGARPDSREGPRGRGLGKPTKTVSRCSRCGSTTGPEPAPEDSCKSCGSDLHTCTNCRHFDSSAPNECRQPVETRIAAKAKENECGFFATKQVQEFASDATPGGSKMDAKSAFDDLFDF